MFTCLTPRMSVAIFMSLPCSHIQICVPDEQIIDSVRTARCRRCWMRGTSESMTKANDGPYVNVLQSLPSCQTGSLHHPTSPRQSLAFCRCRDKQFPSDVSGTIQWQQLPDRYIVVFTNLCCARVARM